MWTARLFWLVGPLDSLGSNINHVVQIKYAIPEENVSLSRRPWRFIEIVYVRRTGLRGRTCEW